MIHTTTRHSFSHCTAVISNELFSSRMFSRGIFVVSMLLCVPHIRSSHGQAHAGDRKEETTWGEDHTVYSYMFPDWCIFVFRVS